MDNGKRKRGRPRKSVEDNTDGKHKDDDKKEKKDDNIVVFLALSDDESNDSGEDNRFTTNDTETHNDVIDSISNSNSDTDSDSDSDNDSDSDSGEIGSEKNMDIKSLIKQIKKKDVIINNLRSKINITGSNANTMNNTSTYSTGHRSFQGNKQPEFKYHHLKNVITVDSTSGKIIEPETTNIVCWWCDENFTNYPAYIVNRYKNKHYYVFGNFCSFNCAAKYNIKMLKDCSFCTRHALINKLKTHMTGDPSPIKLAADRELLKSKGGMLTIEKFRENFNIISPHISLNIPPMIPLVHIVEHR